MNSLPFLTGLIGIGVTFLLVPLIIRLSRSPEPAQRGADLHHTHSAQMPRLGGIALVAAFLAIELVILILQPGSENLRERMVVLGSSLAMFGLGLWDDIRPLGAKKKLLGQILIAVGVCCFGIGIQRFTVPFSGRILDLNAWGMLLTILWLVAMTNLINLIDGVDGLAAGICLMLMTLLAYVGRDNVNLDLVAPGMVGALLGFLWFNFPPARVYLGDGGAYFLGFQVGIFSLVSSQKGTVIVALVAPLFVLALPIVDMSLAIARRGFRGLPIFRPDRKHLHHRLLNMGLSRQKVVLSFYAVTLAFLAMGFAAFSSAGRLVPLLAGLGGLLLLLCAGKLSFSREWFAVRRALEHSVRMREEVQSALCLTRWLAQEGKRHASIESLWADLIFVAQRLGFASLRLTLEDGARTWSLPDDANRRQVHFSRHDLGGGRCGVLELRASIYCSDDSGMAEGPVETGIEEANASFRTSQIKLFEILAELIAEGWFKAANAWQKESSLPLRFNVKGAQLPSSEPPNSAAALSPAKIIGDRL